jgi:D-arabinose 1-dehydrogenase
MPRPSIPLSSTLPPLICGTATFNSQYNPDPYALPTTAIVHRALSLGIRAFDTSPYYGPAEDLLGSALDTGFVREHFPRDEYYLLTKVGRISGSEFNYSQEWIQQSIQRSLQRLRTSYLDVVYCHDVEFVTAEEVLAAVKELRYIRDTTGLIKYVGISGYPVTILCELAEMILQETGEPLDAVMSYGNFTLQNTLLSSEGIPRLKAAGVDVVPNASPLGMGLFRRQGVPLGAKGDFHPAENGLRSACREASKYCDAYGEKLEVIALRFALETWLNAGGTVGSKGDPASGVPWKRGSIDEVGGLKLGVSVIGVSYIDELDETMGVWRSILDGLEHGKETAIAAGRWEGERDWSLRRRAEIQRHSKGVRKVLGRWVDHTWPSPDASFRRSPPLPLLKDSSPVLGSITDARRSASVADTLAEFKKASRL